LYFALLSAITLAAGLILHALASLLAFAGWRISRRKLDLISPRLASRILLAIRFAPLFVTLIVLAAFVIPSFLEFEPRTTIEPLSFTLLSLASVTGLILSGSILRCFAAVLQSRRVMRAWMSTSKTELVSVEEMPTGLSEINIQRCEMESPVIAVMGIWPTRVFTANKVFDALTTEELNAALRHEAVHVRSFDVLKKMFLQLAPTFLPGVDLLKGVNTHWSRMCELAADEESVAGHAPRTLHLASALVKVARLANPGSELPTLSAALHGRDSLLSHRVRRLLEISEHPGAIATQPVVFDARRVLFAGACMVAIVLAAYPQVLTLTHELLEFLVQG
jgi:Zn-dependent protease with chaperone function